jgi:hypothetical protein
VHPHSVDSLSGLSVDSAQFRQRASHTQLSDDPDTATAQTVAEMCRQIHQAAADPFVQSVARRAVQQFAGGPRNFQAADACWIWAKHYLRFKHHGSMFEAWSSDLGDPRTKMQLLIAPDVLLRMSRLEGDCAIYTMMICAMLEALGIQWDIVTAAVDARQPEIFGHVWPRAVLPDGNREPLDASHGKYPGWQVPAYDLHRVWIFNASGQRVGGEVGPRFTGLHAYRVQTRRRGLGTTVCDDMGENCYDDGTTYSGTGTATSLGTSMGPANPFTDQSGTMTTCADGSVVAAGVACPNQWQDASGSTYSGSTYTTPSQSSSQWASFAAAMGKAGMSIASINALKPGMVISPNGTMLYQNPGYAVGTPTSSLNLSGISSTTMLVGGLIAVALVMMMGRNK